MSSPLRILLSLAAIGLLTTTSVGGRGLASAAKPVLSFTDPTGDDAGPGTYVYPTDHAYTPGSFDLVAVRVYTVGRSVVIHLQMAAPITDPWASTLWDGQGFSLQLAHIYFDTRPKRGARSALPGVNARFGAADGWERVVVVSADNPKVVKKRLRKLRGFKRSAIVVPKKITIEGDTIIVNVSRSQLGRPSKKWGMQVLIAGNDSFAPSDAWWVRSVDAQAGPHRFGGGADGGCDPHVMDLLDGEPGDQAQTLSFSACESDPKFRVTLPMVRAGSQ